MTEFAARILAYVQERGHAGCWQIGQHAFPERWAKPSARGALVGHIDRVACRIPELVRLNPRGVCGDAEYWLRQPALAPAPKAEGDTA